MTELQRRLGTPAATAVGVAAMLGAGIFFVWAPAARVAGAGLLIALPIAAGVAVLNALSTTQLAMRYPVSGGAYAYGRMLLGEAAGFSAGALFLVGKTASVAAISVIAGGYLWPGRERIVAVALIVVFTVVNSVGVRSTALVSAILASAVITVLIVTLIVGGITSTHTAAIGSVGGVGGALGALGVLQAASLIFYSFTGYARIATLSEEVRDPTRTLPRAVVASLLIVLALSVAVALSLVIGLGAERLGASTSPLADLAGSSWAPVIRVGAAVACAGSLLGVLAGLSRTGLAMARDGELPRPLSRIATHSAVPVVAQVTAGVVGIVAVLLTDATMLVGISACAVLGYYGLAHASALRLKPSRLPRGVPIAGLVCCAALALAAPWQAIVITVALLAVALAVRALVRLAGRSRRQA